MKGGFSKNGDHRVLIVMLTMMMMMMMMQSVLGTLHRVGGKMGWSQNVNFTEWSAHQHFHIHDWLLFNFDKHIFNVLEVNKTSYESCNEQGFISNITRGGRDVFQLKEARPYYFISGRGFCWGGMKVAVFVQENPPPPAPAPTKNGSSSSNTGDWISTLLLAVSMALIWSTISNLG